jgi:hypothetical protein
MKPISSSLVCLVFVIPVHFVSGDEKNANLTDYQKAIRGLTAKVIRANLSSEKLLDVCIPTWKRTLGQFTEYEYELLPGYHWLTIIAKNGRLKRAAEWSCTFDRTYFDELTRDDEKRYEKLWKDNQHVPFDRCIGRCGWERPRMRDWVRDQARPGGASER